MITVNFTGAARKSFQTDSLTITQNISTISELITYLISQKPENTPGFDGKNLLIAVNGVDSSALDGNNTHLKSDDIVKELNELKPKIKHQIAQKTKHQLRKMPDLAFYNDDSLEYINKLEDAVQEKENPIIDTNLLDKRKKI